MNNGKCTDYDWAYDPGFDKVRKGRDKITVLEILVCATVFIGIVTLLLELAVMWFGIGTTWEWAANYVHELFVMVPFSIYFAEFDGMGSQLWWLMLVLVITGSVALMFSKSKAAFKKESYVNGDLLKTPLYWIMVCFAAGFMIYSIISWILIATGMDLLPSSELPNGISSEGLYLYADAAVWEEVVCRMLFMGVPMAVVALALRESGCWKYLFGGFGMSRLCVILIIFSAVMFGIGHYESGGVWKIFPAIISGLLYGFLFARFGIYATILVHFMTGYLSSLEIFGQTPNGLLTMLIVLMGFLSVLYILDYLGKNKNFWRRIPYLLPEKNE